MNLNDSLLLAFDSDDTKKIVNLFDKEKNREILAFTPNSYEILSSNGFNNIITPYQVNPNLHQEVAKDNILIRSNLENLCKNKVHYSSYDENFKNIFIQCLSTINFFSKILKNENSYICLLDKDTNKKNYHEVLNLILDFIITKKYGVFKLSFFFKSKELFSLKNIINNILFSYIQNKNIIFNFLGNKKKMSKNHNDIEIAIGTFSDSRLYNLYLILKNFFKFFNRNNIKIIYTDITYDKNILVEKQIKNLLKLFNNHSSIFENKNLVFFLSEVLLYNVALTNFLEKRFDKLKIKFLISDYLTWMNPNIVAKFLYNKSLNVFLCSHGNMDTSNDIYSNAELLSLGKGLCYSEYATNIIAQSPTAYKISKMLNNSKKINIIKSHPLAYNGQRQSKYISNKNINILFAGTYKVFLSRPYIYQGSYQFIDTIKKLSSIFKKNSNINLTLNIRTNDEIDNEVYKNLLKDLPNSRLLFNSNIENLMQNSNLLITNFSTLIDEFSYLNKPVVILNDFLKHECYKHFYPKSEIDGLKSIYYFNIKEFESELPDIIKKIKKNSEILKPKHIWSQNEVLDNHSLINKIMGRICEIN